MKKERGARAKKAEETRLALIAAARKLFTERGYHAVGIRDFATEAGVTRGALYHHFGDKESIFLAVFDAVERDLMAAGAQAAPTGLDAWAAFRQSLQLYLDAATQPEVQRITLIDGPAVLGWARWQALEAEYGLASVVNVLNAAMAEGLVKPQPIQPLAQLILGSIGQAALLIAHSATPEATRAEVGQALDSLLRGLE
jgi:AcrR family transcriptional regulator